MAEYENKKGLVISEQEIVHLNEMMKSFDSDISAAMSYVRRVQKLTFSQLEKRFSGIQGNTLKRYMHQSYPSMRPIHVVAAYSWLTMVPMTAFFHGFKRNKRYSGMDDSLVEALIRIGRLPTELMELFLAMICSILSDESKQQFLIFRQKIENKYNKIQESNDIVPPKNLDIEAFAIDYYRSIALTVKQFRQENNFAINTMSRVLGLSDYQYNILENPNRTTHFPVSIGFRVMQGFQLDNYVNFTCEMRWFPEFHELRQNQYVQHVRELLTIEALGYLKTSERKYMINILINLLNIA
ncbi:hypothetical protein [Vibrio spartinae]|uniref:Uncharacterized protein n=1 Tax=Vibrio spartinae TaxID=1918945 RepID=A0ABX6R5U1_9VIBR|nr:hypothetical protein [Vibrio spartinae]QMV16697.1 hypothetical protein Vspart_04101 [Vibrio spartinae]